MKENSIEKDIKVLENLLDEGFEAMCYEEAQAIEHILSDYKRVLKEKEELKEYITIAPNLDEMTAVKYRNIQQDAYIKGRADEQQKAEQIIYENYIPVQEVKYKIEELNKNILNAERFDEIILKYRYQKQALQELLEGRK